MEKQEYESIRSQEAYDLKCQIRWEAEERKFEEIYREAELKDLMWQIKNQ